MEDLISKLKYRFRSGDMLTKILFVNIGLFILLRLAEVVCILFGLDQSFLLWAFEMPSNLETLLYRPWTVLTYMFVHMDILHILFNMLWLYWFGKIFLQFFNERQLTGLYFLGGLAGALFFLVSYNVFPYFRSAAPFSHLIGASAAVMAIVFAVSFYKKDYEIQLLFIGRIKLLYLALFTLLIDLISITSENAGGHLAHIGGALIGIWFAYRIRQGKDLTTPFNRILDALCNVGKRRPKMTVTHTKTSKNADYEYNARKNENTEKMNQILDKVKQSGYDSLSLEEKKSLFDASKR